MREKMLAVQKEMCRELREEAVRLREEFENYLEDLILLSDPEFWEALEEESTGKIKKYSTIEEFKKKLGL